MLKCRTITTPKLVFVHHLCRSVPPVHAHTMVFVLCTRAGGAIDKLCSTLTVQGS